jgi:hypothetical protein
MSARVVDAVTAKGSFGSSITHPVVTPGLDAARRDRHEPLLPQATQRAAGRAAVGVSLRRLCRISASDIEPARMRSRASARDSRRERLS